MSHSLDWIYDVILAALPAYGSENIIRSKQQLTIPSDPFITYGVISLDTSRFEKTLADSALYPDPGVTPEVLGTFDRTYQQNCGLQIQIDCYSPAGLADIQTLISFMHSDGAQEIFDAAHVSLVGAGTVKNLDFLADNDYRDRWMVSCDFMIAMTRVESRYAILEWELAGAIDDPVDEIEITIQAQGVKNDHAYYKVCYCFDAPRLESRARGDF